jgi:ribosome-associated protein
MGLVRKKDMRKTIKPGQAQEDQPVRLSRTQKKKAALSLQDLGERLVQLSDEQLKQVGLPEDVLAAVKTTKTIKKHGPLHRQMQYIGAVMRLYDPAPFREFLDTLDQRNRQQAAKSKKLFSPK